MKNRYKLQYFDDRNISWLDIQKTYSTYDEARSNVTSGKEYRVIEITRDGRSNLCTVKKDGTECVHPSGRVYVFTNSIGKTKRTCCVMCQDQLLW
jgi:hypothetical protein